MPPPTDSGHLRALLSPSAPKPARLLWVGAHPDDEAMVAGVLLAKACVAQGYECTLVTLESGRNGRCRGVSLLDHTCPCPGGAQECPEELSWRRADEFRHAARALHATPRVLFHDNEMDAAHEAQMIAEIVDLVRKSHATILVTHGTEGGYGHPAHRWTNRVVRTAWYSLPANERPELFFGLDLTPRTIDADAVTDTLDGSERLPSSARRPERTLWEVVLGALEQHHTQTAIEHMRALGPDRQRSSFHRFEPPESTSGSDRPTHEPPDGHHHPRALGPEPEPDELDD